MLSKGKTRQKGCAHQGLPVSSVQHDADAVQLDQGVFQQHPDTALSVTLCDSITDTLDASSVFDFFSQVKIRAERAIRTKGVCAPGPAGSRRSA